jgi:hypothetical protein
MTTFREWGEQVKAIIPSLVQVASDNGLFFNGDAAERLLDDGEYLTVYTMLQAVCEGLASIPVAMTDHESLCSILVQYPHEEQH